MHKVKRKVAKREKKQPSTANGKMIQDLLDQRKVKGNYKDFMVIAGNRIIDWTGSWDVFNDKGEPTGHDGVILVHKSKIHTIVGEQFARRFWHPRLGRIHPTQKERNPNAVRHPAD
jgi:hypothetical protein